MAEPHIVVVDDDHGVREILQELLTQEGYQVTVAADGPSAIQTVQDASCIWSSPICGCRGWMACTYWNESANWMRRSSACHDGLWRSIRQSKP